MRAGLLLVDKPSGPTSAEVVRRVKARHRPSALGHLGTLDPMATGILPLCFEGATRLAPFLLAETKGYRGSIQLGVRTDTLDVTGKILEEVALPSFEAVALGGIAEKLCGPQMQQPPMFSAVRVGGRRLHELARAGIEVERPAREIRIDTLELEWLDRVGGLISFRVDCSKGTYVRVLAESIGAGLGVPAALASLERFRVGAFELDECISLEAVLERSTEELPLLTPAEALRGSRRLTASLELAGRIAAGQRAALNELAAPEPSEDVGCIMSPAGRLVAVVRASAGAWSLARVLEREPAE